jgi:hypothetical protein
VSFEVHADVRTCSSGGPSPTLFDDGEFRLVKDLPERTDDGETAAPFLRVKQKTREPDFGKRMPRSEMYDLLLSQDGPFCKGCDRKFDDPRYLELDQTRLVPMEE